MVGRRTCDSGINTLKTECTQVEFVNEDVDYTHRIFFRYEIVLTIRQQGDLSSSLTFNEAFYERTPYDLDVEKTRYTTQKFHVIDSVFKVYGLKNLTKNAAQKTAKAHVLSRVEDLIDRRHEIAHAGDYNKHNRIQDIDHARVKVWLTALEDLVMLPLTEN